VQPDSGAQAHAADHCHAGGTAIGGTVIWNPPGCPSPVRLLSDYTRRPLAVAIYAVAFIAAMQLQRLIWLDVTRPAADLCRIAPLTLAAREVRAGLLGAAQRA
jgi:hypothetical protein